MHVDFESRGKPAQRHVESLTVLILYYIPKEIELNWEDVDNGLISTVRDSYCLRKPQSYLCMSKESVLRIPLAMAWPTPTAFQASSILQLRDAPAAISYSRTH